MVILADYLNARAGCVEVSLVSITNASRLLRSSSAGGQYQLPSFSWLVLKTQRPQKYDTSGMNKWIQTNATYRTMHELS